MHLRLSQNGTILGHASNRPVDAPKILDRESGVADAREPTLAWYRHVLKADRQAPADMKRDFRTVSVLRDGRAVFNIAGNKYRLVVWINYSYRVVYILFIGTHAQYDRIDSQTI